MKREKTLIALKSNPKNGWIKIGVEGEWEGHESGKFSLSKECFSQMVDNAKKSNIAIVVDYEHATLTEPKAPASGWIEPHHIKEDKGELWVKIDWTKEAKAHIDAKEYRYLSPVFVFHTKQRVTGEDIGATLHSVALTNTPFLEELGAIANKHKTKENTTMEELQAQLQEAQNRLANKDIEIQKLKDTIKTLQEIQEAQRVANAKAKVADAIASAKLSKNQEAWALKYAQSDEEGFDEYLKHSIATAPLDGEMFANSTTKKGDDETPIDVAKV